MRWARRQAQGHAADLPHQTKRYGVGVGLLPLRLGAGDDRVPVRRSKEGEGRVSERAHTTELITDALLAVRSGSRDNAMELLKAPSRGQTVWQRQEVRRVHTQRGRPQKARLAEALDAW